MSHQITIHVNRETFHVDKQELTADEIRALVSAPADYEVWKVVHSPDPEGQLPKDDIQITTTVVLHNGDHFRVVPPGTFGGRLR